MIHLKTSNKNQAEQCFYFMFCNPKELLDNKWVDEEFLTQWYEAFPSFNMLLFLQKYNFSLL
jgi:hypothetical protein